jgi:trehalose synthase-fused probable maltokinase
VSEPASCRVDSAADLFSADVTHLESALPGFLRKQRWFAGKTLEVTSATVADAVPCGRQENAKHNFRLLIADVLFSDESRQQYAIPVAVESLVEADASQTILCFVEYGRNESPAALVEASSQPAFWRQLLKQATGLDADTPLEESRVRFVPTEFAPDWTIDDLNKLSIELREAEQSNTSVVLGSGHFLKLFRRPSPEINPDVEIGVFLTRSSRFDSSPAVAGHVEYLPPDGPPECLALISELVPATSDAWSFTHSCVDEFWQQLFVSQKMLEESPSGVDWSIASCGEPLPDDGELLGEFVAEAALLGRRTAELHIALASDHETAAFRPEPASEESVREHLTTIRREVQSTAVLLESAELHDPIAPELPNQIRETALARLDEFEAVAADIAYRQIRVHGDYHLGQVLRTAADFVIIDFEGEPDRPISERREKRSAMKDVAGLVRSLHYAACAGAANLIPALDDRSIPENVTAWQNFWFGCAARSFLSGYFEAASGDVFLPESPAQTQQLLDLYVLEKVLYELRYELNNRPDWVAIPLAGLKAVLGL